jgi:RNA polymerase primary sigma factor
MAQRQFNGEGVESSLDTYFREINQTPLLTAEQEKQLARRILQGDGQARDQMVRANLRLVVNIARGYNGKGLSMQDLIEEGNLGLLRAVESFDPTMNTRFSTYSSYWIKQAIQRAIVNTAKTIRIPTYMFDLLGKWNRAAIQLQEELGRVPTPEEVGRTIGLSKKKIAIIQRAIRVTNVTNQTDQPETGYTMEEMLLDERDHAPDTDLIALERKRHVLELIHQMEPREVAVLRMRFGLNDEEPKTLKEIGECLRLTRERVRQIECEALRKLSRRLRGD